MDDNLFYPGKNLFDLAILNFSESNSSVIFRISNLIFEPINPYKCCVVPSHYFSTGKAYPHSQKIFIIKKRVFTKLGYNFSLQPILQLESPRMTTGECQ